MEIYLWFLVLGWHPSREVAWSCQWADSVARSCGDTDMPKMPLGWSLFLGGLWEAQPASWGLEGLSQQQTLSQEVPSCSPFLLKKGEGVQKGKKTETLILQVSQHYPRKQRNRVSKEGQPAEVNYVWYGLPPKQCLCGRLLCWNRLSHWPLGRLGSWGNSILNEAKDRGSGWMSVATGCELHVYRLYRVSKLWKTASARSTGFISTLLIFKDWIWSSLISFDWNIIQAKIAFHGTGETLQNLSRFLKRERLIYL